MPRRGKPRSRTVVIKSSPEAGVQKLCVVSILFNELCADCVPVLPRAGGPGQNEDTAA